MSAVESGKWPLPRIPLLASFLFCGTFSGMLHAAPHSGKVHTLNLCSELVILLFQFPQLRTSKNKTDGPGGGGGDADDFDAWMKSRQLLKPDDQLDLTEAELGEEITKVLTPTNTNIVRNLVVYSFKEGEFVPAPLPGNTVTLIAFAGNSLHVDSDEGRRQIEESDEIGYPLPMPNYTVVEQRETDNVDGEEGEGEEDDDGAT